MNDAIFGELRLPHPRYVLPLIRHKRDLHSLIKGEHVLNGQRFSGIDITSSIYINYRLLRASHCSSPGCNGHMQIRRG